MVQTNDTQKYATFQMSTRKPAVRFKVKACHSAYIGLSDDGLDRFEEDYEVIIGHNTNSNSTVWQVSEQGTRTLLAMASTVGVLNCYQPRTFWVSWSGGNIRVGYNNPDTNTFLDTTVSDFKHITAVSLSTPPELIGSYELSQFLGEFNIVCTV